MNDSIKINVPPNQPPERLEAWLGKNVKDLSRHKAIELIRDGAVYVDGRKAKKGIRVSAGQIIDVRPIAVAHADAIATDQPTVLHSDADLVVVDKSAGMRCHALRLGETDTLLQWVGERFPEVLTAGPKSREGGLLHRLDTYTSGCVAFARTPDAFAEWAPKFLGGGIGKTYLALVSNGEADGVSDREDDGQLRFDPPFELREAAPPLEVGKRLVIDTPLARSSSDAGRMVAVIWGDEKKRGPVMEARTEIKTLAIGDDCALVEATIERGRMHQIRVHLATIGHPIIGDKLYNPDCGSNGGRNCGEGRQMLHAWKLELDGIEVKAPLPEDMKRMIQSRGIHWVD